MTSQLNDVFSKQFDHANNKLESDAGKFLEFVKFVSANTNYLIELGNVREITDMPPVTAYPQSYAGHIGLINLRGEILPVLSVGRDASRHAGDKRAIVIEYENGNKLCFPASEIKKVILDAQALTTQNTFDIDGQASALFNLRNLPALDEIK